MLTSDFYNWVYTYQNEHVSALFTCYGYPGLHQLYHIPFFVAYKLFGLNSTLWIAFFVFLHSINAYLVHYWAKLWLDKLKKSNYWSVFAALLFLISPFQTEAVAWGATIHYLLITLFFLLSLIALFNFLKFNKKIHWFTFFIFFVLSLFTMEQSFLFPLAYLALALLMVGKIELKRIFQFIIVPCLLILVAYFSLSKLVFGAFIGHYGAEEHLKFDFFLILNTLYLYLLKFISFFRYIEFDAKRKLVSLFSNSIFQITTIGLFTFLCLKNFLFTNDRRISILKVILLHLCIFIFCLGPVLNIVMDSLISIQTDRYSYLASGFFYISVVLIISNFNKNISHSISVFLVAFSAYTLYSTIQNYKEAGIIKNTMLESIQPYQNESKIWVLNMPDNYNGVHLFRNGFFTASDLHNKTDLRFKYEIISHVNFTTLQDNIAVEQLGSKTLLVQLPKWGRWIHTNSYETESYVMKKQSIDGFDLAYTLEIKSNTTPTTILYVNKGIWQQYQLN